MSSTSASCATKAASIVATLWTIAYTVASTLYRPLGTGKLTLTLTHSPVSIPKAALCSLKPLDVEFMKKLHSKVNIVPVIAKADCLTKKEILRLKCRIMQEIEGHGIKIYPLPDCDSDEDEDYKEQVKQLKEAVPFAVCGANTLLEVKGKKVRGRLYPWGVVEVENPDHCDFIKLRTMLITHMQDLQEVTQEVHYENYRSDRLAKGIKVKENGIKQERDNNVNAQAQANNALSEKDRILQEKEAELARMTEMLAQMQARMQAQH
ncbi:blast:Septin-1 [Drosophila guanche]|uniref:Blast:Septin-1 n=1 Tax=Drosophila guanche TaxID=7266 RepID=A0A3B0JYK4_DROGU|nr:blast:Septin-1 [Drosophila guanche]